MLWTDNVLKSPRKIWEDKDGNMRIEAYWLDKLWDWLDEKSKELRAKDRSPFEHWCLQTVWDMKKQIKRICIPFFIDAIEEGIKNGTYKPYS